MAQTGYALTQRDKDEFNRIIRKVDSIRGAGVVNNPNNISINSTAPKRQRGSTSDDLPTPQYQYMVIGAISQNQLGAFFTPAVSMSMT
jgi:hypothetical protein